ncbi:hypothetical protein HBJ58_18840 [Halomonas desiderata]|uniref:hypothetical protein n=1 Tax=Billgrantia desiderata TaxID=52021 RepID=UPI001748170E|nr:hypothetical protein [Halomonas desiderata]
MNQSMDTTSLLKGLEGMAIIGLPEYDELRQAIGGVVVASVNLDFRQGRISQADHAATLKRVRELVPSQKTH